MKTCTKCQKVLPPEQFHANARRKDGRDNRCRDCSKQSWKGRPGRLAYIEPPTEKPCTRCNQTLPASDFPKNNYNKSGLNSRCRVCCLEDHRQRMETLVIVPVTEKVCPGCRRTLDAASFGNKSNNNDGLQSHCKECMRLYKIERLYKITPEQYQEMIKDGCQICGSFNRLVVDHDHACCQGEKSCGECVRGILCDDHNNGLGRFNDDPALLRAAIEYLRA